MSASGRHVVVLVHGLHGTVADLAFVGDALRREYGDEVVVLAPDVNHGRTRGGIDAQTVRLLAALKRALEEGGPASGARYLSLIGHSLGGLIARRLAYVLQRDAIVPARLRPLALVTVATPHLGSRHHARLSGALHLHRIGAAIAALALGQTGRELFLDDDDKLLQAMADDAHLDALRLFQVRVLYACTRSDTSVGFATAALCRRNRHGDGPGGLLIQLNDDEDADDDGAWPSLLDATEERLCDRLRRVGWHRFAFTPPRRLAGHLDVIVTDPSRAPYGGAVIDNLVQHLSCTGPMTNWSGI